MVLTRNGLAKQLANFKMPTVVVPCDEEENESNFDDEWFAIKKQRHMLEIEKIELDQLKKRTSIQTQNIANKQAEIDSISNFFALIKSVDNDVTVDYDTRRDLKKLAMEQFFASA